MGHRTVKRVPLDFDAPLNKVWSGYVMPGELRPPDCPDCEGTGWSPTARWLDRTFYDHNVAGGLGWRDKLLQADVDALVEAGRLRHLVKREPTEDNPRNWQWVSVPRTADEVNAAQRGAGSFRSELELEAISRGILVKERCRRLGTSELCDRCKGRAMDCTDAEYEAWENWVGTEPPEGEGWQLWETTSEGSPQSPVFRTARELADWCALNATLFAHMRQSADEWLRSFEAGTTDVDSLLVVTVKLEET
jgi:hypothetical protein